MNNIDLHNHNEFSFVLLSIMFDKINKKQRIELGSNDQGSKDPDERKPGDI